MNSAELKHAQCRNAVLEILTDANIEYVGVSIYSMSKPLTALPGNPGIIVFPDDNYQLSKEQTQKVWIENGVQRGHKYGRVSSRVYGIRFENLAEIHDAISILATQFSSVAIAHCLQVDDCLDEILSAMMKGDYQDKIVLPIEWIQCEVDNRMYPWNEKPGDFYWQYGMEYIVKINTLTTT